MSIFPENIIIAPAAAPLLVDNTTITGIAVDTAPNGKKAAWCTLIVYFGVSDVALTALKLTECDTSGGTYADVTGGIFGTSTAPSGATSILPPADPSGYVFIIDVDCRKTERFLKIAGTVGNGTAGDNVTAIAVLYGANQSPTTSIERGATAATTHLIVD